MRRGKSSTVKTPPGAPGQRKHPIAVARNLYVEKEDFTPSRRCFPGTNLLYPRLEPMEKGKDAALRAQRRRPAP